MITGVSIRRVGGEYDPLSEVVLEIDYNGQTIELGREKIYSNFSSYWNVTPEALNDRKITVSEIPNG